MPDHLETNQTTPTLSVRRYGASPGSHRHGHFQVLVGLEGVLELEIDGRGWRVAAGDGVVVAPQQRHDFESARGSRCLVLDTDEARWARCDSPPRPAEQVRALARYLAHSLGRGQPLAACHGPALLLEAWALHGSPPPRARRPVDWAELTRWAGRHLHQPLTVADLAAQVHLSSSQFTHRCHDMLGTSPQAWLRALRLSHAQQLRATGLPVQEAARRSGYRSPSALTAALRRQRNT
jgi:AraC-like DNA-binding protein/mannose-6-phosphate isomerase-like protein (cupin superfamily)